MKKWPFYLAASSLLMSACQAPGEGEEDADSSITFAFHYPTEVLNPAVDANYTSVRVGIAETLAYTGEEGIEPWLAESWEDTGDNTWTFQIKENITFQDGTVLDAEAVQASLEETIEQSPAMQEALGISSMEAEGQELIITTEETNHFLPSELVHPNTAVFKEEEDLIGTGPFEVESFRANQDLELIRYDDYWNGAAQIAEATVLFNEDANSRMAALRSGDADIVYRPPVEETEEAAEEFQVDTVSSLRTHQLIYQMDNPALQDERVRGALDILIDREAVIEAMNGEAEEALGPFLEDFSFAANKEQNENSLEEASALLEEAGYTLEDGRAVKGGEALEFSLVTYSARPELPIAAQILQDRAEQAGITIDIQLNEQIDDYLMSNDSWDMTIYSYVTAPRGDAGYFLNTAYTPDGGLNFGGLNDPQLAEIIESFNMESDPEARDGYAVEATEMILDKHYHSFIVHPSNSVAMQENITGWETSPSEYYMLTNEVGVEE